jgi:hypothetical protein
VGHAKFDSRILEAAKTGSRLEGANGIQRRQVAAAEWHDGRA